MGGMRPKAVIHDGGRQYVAKFPSTSDRQFNVPAVEYATLGLARECGLDVPETRRVRIDGERAGIRSGVALHILGLADPQTVPVRVLQAELGHVIKRSV